MKMSFALQLTRRLLALIAGLASLAAMWTFTAKPWVWEWLGRPDEIYPEIVFLILGLPVAAVAVASGGWIAWKAHERVEPSWTFTIARVLNILALAICLWLSWTALSAFLAQT